MNITYRVLDTHTVDATGANVRFYTDILTEDVLCIERGPNNEILRTRGDRWVSAPLWPMTEAELDKYIQGHCDAQWMEDEELRELAKTTAPDVDLANINSLLSNLPTTPVTFTVKTRPKTVGEWLEFKKEEVIGRRDRLITSGGFPLTVGGTQYWIHSDEVNTLRQLGLINGAILAKLSGAADTTVIYPAPWKTMNASTITLTVGVALSMLPAAFGQQGAMFAAAATHTANLEAHPNPKEYDTTVGWPVTFQTLV